AVLLAFNRDRTLQTFQNNHAHPPRAPIRKFRTSQRRILTGHAETVGLVAGLTVRRENFLAAIVRRKLDLLAGRSAGYCFLRRRRRAHWVESATGEIS